MKRPMCCAILGALLVAGAQCRPLRAETGYEAWLRYAPLSVDESQKYNSLPATAVLLGIQRVGVRADRIDSRRSRHAWKNSS